ncbi:MAG: DNA ligase D [Gammaproteobacteria bacterium]|nr:MAG: DNA ligase D [Gammaproteobacteria bacterium]
MPTRKPRSPTDLLKQYRDKRKSGATPEPFGQRAAAEKPSASGAAGLFVVQQHRASHLHFDLRLEMDGVLKSWAVPKGPSANPADKRFAVHVEDHPIEYADFEGRIPDGNYGAGHVIIWDKGTWRALNDIDDGWRTGKLLFELAGYKLRGRWTLVRMKHRRTERDEPGGLENEPGNEWLLIKEHDGWTQPADFEFTNDSVMSGLTVHELADTGAPARRLMRAVRRYDPPKARATNKPPRPMLASPGEAFDRAGWLFEFKYDGYRLLGRKSESGVELLSRNGRDLTHLFPETASALRSLPFPRLLIDGEIVVNDATGRPSFSALQQRAALRDQVEIARAGRYAPATYYVFDLLEAGDYDLRSLPLKHRKRLLQSLLPSTGPTRYSEHVAGKGRSTYRAARQLGIEGIVGKRADSVYREGRSQDWIKVRARKSDDFVVVGWAPAKGDRADLGALLLAEYRAEQLCYVGRVGSGLGGELRRELLGLLRNLPDAPGLLDSNPGRWVQPVLVCEVAFTEYTREGHLRQPVFLRMRDDKEPTQCNGQYDDPHPRAPHAVPEIEVTITNRTKEFYPEKSLSKGDLIDYYDAIAPWMLPYLKDRPIVLTRFPDGIHGKSFYQRDAPEFVPDWIERKVLYSESTEREVHYFVVQNAAALKYLINLGTIPIHTWHSRIDDLERPDWCVLDLDPKDAPFSDVIAAARAIRVLAEEIELPAFLKTSGASGLHVLLPLGNQLTHDQSKTLAELMARIIVSRLPERTTITRRVKERGGKVYIDYLQNGHGQLLVAPFSARAEPAASVSMPLRWSELTARLRNDKYHLKNAPARMRRLGEDPMAEVLSLKPDLAASLERLAAIMQAN